MKTWPSKDPDEILDYGFNFLPRMMGEVDPIVEHTADVVIGDVIIDNSEIVTGKTRTKTRLSGGTDGTDCQVLLRVVCASGQSYDETLKIKIKSR